MSITQNKIALSLIVKRCYQKDKRAQMELYNLFSTMAYRTAYRVVQDPAKAEDLMHDSFLVAFEKIDQLENPNGFGGWLKQIVYRKSLHEIKQSNRTQIESLPEQDMDPWEVSQDEEHSEQVLALQQALKKLKPETQKLLQLFYYSNMSHEEIAKELKISSGACRTRLSRAKEKLRKYLT